jgi:hypothetical protein
MRRHAETGRHPHLPHPATDGHLVCSVSYASTVSLRLQRFGDQLALYDLGVPSWDELVAAAADALADGCDGPAVVALASQPATGPRDEFELKDIVAAAREELGMPVPDEVATSVRATQGQIRRWQRGLLSDAELLSFVHWQAGEGTPDLARLWSLFVWMEDKDYMRQDRLEIHDDIVVTAERILHVFDPWLSDRKA